MSSKRSLSVSSRESSAAIIKRSKLNGPDEEAALDGVAIVDSPEFEDEAVAVQSMVSSRHANARVGIQRSIAMVLKHDGFASSTPEAMESFTSLVETCVLRRSLLMNSNSCPGH